MEKIILILILAWSILLPCYAGEKQDYTIKAEESHAQTSVDTLYPILELKALYYQNQQIIIELRNINQTLKELNKDEEISEKQTQLLQEILQELKSSKIPLNAPPY